MSAVVKVIYNLCLYALIAYLLLLVLLYIFQRSLLYYPDKQSPSSMNLAAENLRLWPDRDQYFGLIGAAQKARSRGTFIIFHGNAGAAIHRTYYIDALSKLNFRVILAEYPGYGGRSGEPNAVALVESALEIVMAAKQRYSGPIYLWGESLGAGVVTGVVARAEVPIDGVVLMTPWDSLLKVAQAHYWYMPVKWLLKDRYDSTENLRGYQGQVAVIVAERDEVIPVKHGLALYDSIESNKRLWNFKGAKHNTIPISDELK